MVITKLPRVVYNVLTYIILKNESSTFNIVEATSNVVSLISTYVALLVKKLIKKIIFDAVITKFAVVQNIY